MASPQIDYGSRSGRRSPAGWRAVPVQDRYVLTGEAELGDRLLVGRIGWRVEDAAV